MVLVCAILIWAPLPLGSNRPWSWSFLAAGIALALLLWAMAQMLEVQPRAKAVWPVGLAAATTVPVWAWAFAQTLPAATSPWLQPQAIWAEAAAAGAHGAAPMVGLDADAGGDALMRLLSYAGAFWLAWRLGTTSERARRLLVVILTVITLCAAYGLVAQLAGWEAIGWIPKTVYIGDATGTFVNRNSFATYTNLGVVICLALLAQPFLAAREVGDLRRIAAQAASQMLERHALLLLALAILVMASLRSHSRGGLLSLVLTVAVMALLLFIAARPRLPTILAAVAAMCLAGWSLIAVSGGGTLERIGQIDANYDLEEAGRLAYWQVSLGMVAERPWQGYGYGNFEEAFAQHRDERFNDRVDKAHNTYIEHLVELGVPATALLYLGPLVLFGYCVRGLLVRRRNQVFPLVAVGATVLVGLHALVDFSLQIPAVAVTFATLLGIGVAQATPSESRVYGAESLRR